MDFIFSFVDTTALAGACSISQIDTLLWGMHSASGCGEARFSAKADSRWEAYRAGSHAVFVVVGAMGWPLLNLAGGVTDDGPILFGLMNGSRKEDTNSTTVVCFHCVCAVSTDDVFFFFNSRKGVRESACER